MTTKAWAAKAFEMMVWQLTFMPDGLEKQKVLQFLLDAPDEVKRMAQRKLPDLTN